MTDNFFMITARESAIDFSSGELSDFEGFSFKSSNLFLSQNLSRIFIQQMVFAMFLAAKVSN